MPRYTLKLRKDCWTALAGVVFLTGVIGCQGSPTHAGANADAAPMGSDATDAILTGSDAADAGPANSDAAGTEPAPRPTFESYDEVLYVYMGTFTPFGELLITAEGDVYTASGKALTRGLVGRATKDEMDTFVEIATRPATLAAFALTDTTGCGVLADGYDELSLTIKDMPVYKRHNACPGLTELQNQAHAVLSNVSARARDAGGQ